MEVILKQDIDKLGKSGSVVKVKEGFARNFLLPRSLAVPVTPANLKRIEQEKNRIQAKDLRKKELALQLSNRLNAISLTIAVQTHDEDKLYGSISALDIVSALQQERVSEISPDAIVFDDPIKSTGVYEVTIKLHPEVSSKIKIWVVKK